MGSANLAELARADRHELTTSIRLEPTTGLDAVNTTPHEGHSIGLDPIQCFERPGRGTGVAKQIVC
jgi:hypothetical protein